MYKVLITFIGVGILGMLTYFAFSSHAQIELRYQIQNTVTGEQVKEDDELFEGDILERVVVIKNKGKEEIKNYSFTDINPFTQSKSNYEINLEVGEVQFLREKFPLKKSHEQDLKDFYKKKIQDQKINKEKIEVEEIADIKNLEKNKEKLVKKEAKEDIKKEMQEDVGNANSSISIKIREPVFDFWAIESLSTDKINNNFDAFLEIRGKHLELLKEIVIQCSVKTEFFAVSASSLSFLQVLIPAFSLESGVCNIGGVVNNVVYFSEKKIVVQQDQKEGAELLLKNIIPNTGTTTKDSLVVMTGKGFDKVVAVQVDNGVVLGLSFLEKVSDTTMVVNIPKGLKEGEYFFRFLTKNNVQSFPYIKFKITQDYE